MASITPYQTKAGRRWRVRYRKPDRTQTDKRGFKTKRDAALFAATVETSKATGTYIDPTAGKITIGELGTDWLTRQGHWKPSYRRTVESAWRIHVQPRFGAWPVGSIKRSDVQAWIAELSTAGKSASLISTCYGVLKGIAEDAVADQLIPTSPVAGIPLPKRVPARRRYLSHSEVSALAAASRYPGVVLVLAYTGLRFGEMAGLRVRNVDLLRRRITVEVSATEVGGKIVEGAVKTWSNRTVPIPRFLADVLAVECHGKRPNDLVFSVEGRYLRPTNAARPGDGWMTVAARRAGIEPLTPHDLRHTAASLAVSASANVKAVQRMLGHKSAAVTLDTYADLFDSDLQAVAEALDEARRGVA